MKALVLERPKEISLREIEDPVPGPGEVKIKVKRAGICGTDKAMYFGEYLPGKLPIVLGHEISGEVVDVGEGVSEDLVGKRVTTEINLSCGSCYFCLRGMYTHCPYRKVLGINCDGGMAEYVITRENAIHPIGRMSHGEGAMVEPLAAAIRTVELRPPEKGARIAILGAGTISLLSLQVLRQFSDEIYVISRKNEVKEDLAMKLGAKEFVPVERAKELVEKKTPEGMGFDYVLEGTGSPSGASLAISLARPLGTVILKSTHGKPSQIDVTSIAVKELRVLGTRCGPFDKAIKAILSGKIGVKELITHVFPLEEFKEAFETSISSESVKVQLEP